jgi:hypothetical protein
MPRVGFEPTIPVSERAKRVHALDRDATAIDIKRLYPFQKTRYVINYKWTSTPNPSPVSLLLPVMIIRAVIALARIYWRLCVSLLYA